MSNSLYETEEEKSRRLTQQQTTQSLDEITTRDALEHAYAKANPNGGYVTMTGPLGDFSFINMVNANLKSSNKDKLQETTIDNYAHCLANYNSAKRGNWGRLTTKVIGNTREAFDYAKNILNKNSEYASHDFKNDTTINRISINRADSNMYNTSQEACSRFKPKLLDEEKYKKWYRR